MSLPLDGHTARHWRLRAPYQSLEASTREWHVYAARLLGSTAHAAPHSAGDTAPLSVRTPLRTLGATRMPPCGLLLKPLISLWFH